MPAQLHLSVSRTVRVSRDAVWQVLGDFGTEHRWYEGFSRCVRDTDSVGVGTVRTCTLRRPLMGRTEARETLTEYDPGKALAYALEGPAGPFDSAASRWSLRSVSEGSSLVTVEGHFTARSRLARLLVWPIAKPMLRRLSRRVIGELEAFVAAKKVSAS